MKQQFSYDTLSFLHQNDNYLHPEFNFENKQGNFF